MFGMNPEAKPRKFTGRGTGTSDSIRTKVPEGTFVMPADSVNALGARNLQSMGAPMDINVSNGEMGLPPEQVHAIGVQALEQMKNVTHTPVHPEDRQLDPKMSFANGGLVEDEKRKRERQAMAGKLNETRGGFGKAASAVAGAVGGAYTGLAKAATVVPRTAYGVASGEIPVTVRDLPDYGAPNRQRAAQRWNRENPEQSAAAREGINAVSAKAYQAGMAPPGGPLAMGAPKAKTDAPSQTPTASPTGMQPGQGATGTAVEPQVAGVEHTKRLGDYRSNDWAAHAVGGVAARRNADGVMEFSNDPGALEQTDGRSVGSDRLSVIDGMGAATENLNRAAEIRQQTRLEQSNPNYVSVVRDSGASGMQGVLNQRANQRDDEQRDERSARHRSEVAEGFQRLNDRKQQTIDNSRTARADELAEQTTQQQLDAGELDLAAKQQLQTLREQLLNPELTDSERNTLVAQLNALNGERSGKQDGYSAELVEEPIDPNDPLKGTRKVPYTFDPRTGQWTRAEGGAGPQMPQPGEVRGGYRFVGGNPAEQKNWEKA